MTRSVSFADVTAAASAIAGAVVRTPTARSETMSSIVGADIWIKFENLQYTGAFKERGARNRLLAVTDRQAGVVTMSAGNHAQAVARHASLLGIDAVVVMPLGTPVSKVAGTEADGARVVLEGDTLEAAARAAHDIEAQEGRTFIPPFDDPLIVAGQGTCALELFEDAPPLDALVVPVGGGGLFAGSCITARAVSPATELIGVQSELFPAVLGRTGHRRPDPPRAWGPTIAEGIAVKQPGELTTALIDDLADDVVSVPERAIEEAVVRYLEVEKQVVEGAGAASLAAVLHDRGRFEGRTVGVVLSGGNIDLRLLSAVIMRGLARTGRLTRLVVEVPDAPGGLAALTATVGEAGGNIVDLWHHREFGAHSARVTEVELVVETRDLDHAMRLRSSLEDRGYDVDLLPRRMQ